VRRQPPRSGHRVVAFVDVADSVGLYRRLGDDAAHQIIDDALDAVRAQVIGAHGHCVKRNGDELLLLFAEATAACHAMVDIQSSASLGLRIGIHVGPIIRRPDDVFGDTVNIAARLTALARAGEILVSATLRGQLSDDLQQDCRPFEQMRLRGTTRNVQIFQLCWEPFSATRFNSVVFPTGDTRQRLMLETRSGAVTLQREQQLTIGRDPECDVVLDDTRVSRFHATIEWRSGTVMLRDHSTNGSYVRRSDETRAHFLRREALPINGAGELNFGAGCSDCAVAYRFE
jgi:adenylate cyclase